MAIPVCVHAGALSGGRTEEALGAAEVERVLAAVAERALSQGARAGLDALLRQAPRLTGVAGIALYEGRARLAEVGLRPPSLSRARALQVIRSADGRTALVVHPERLATEARQTLLRLVQLASTLLAARRREAAAQARQARLCRQVRQLESALAYRERNRSRASHDLRTPLLVMKGYVDMMRKGMTGELTPSMERYLDRVMSATQDMGSLITQRLAPGNTPEELLCLLRGAFGALAPARNLSLRCEGTVPAAPLQGPRSTLMLLTRSLARGLASVSATQVDLKLEARETTRMWQLRLSTRAERPLPPRVLQRLEQLVHQLGGTLTAEDEPRLTLTLQLPAAT
jgi:two-component system OmpR family sensor kinase